MLKRGERLVYVCEACDAQVVVVAKDDGVEASGVLLCRAATTPSTGCAGFMEVARGLESFESPQWEWYKPNHTTPQRKGLCKRFRDHLDAEGLEMRRVNSQ